MAYNLVRTFLHFSAILFTITFHLRTSHCSRFSPTGRQTLTDEERLTDIAFRYYDPSCRPVFNASEPVEVILGLNIIKISKMDEVGQMLELNAWLELYWTDKRLTWNPADFNGLEMVRLPLKLLWSPDIVLYNSVEDFQISGDIRAMVAHTGEIFAGPFVKMRSTCILDLTWYPFDDQLCKLVFGSWTYDVGQVIVISNSQRPVLTQFQQSEVWELLDTKIDELRHAHTCCPVVFSDIVISIRMRRRFLFNNLLNIFIPTVWLTVLTILAFWLDPASGEKISLTITILVTFTLFQILVAEQTPRTSDFVPLVIIYLETSYITTACVVGLQVLILNLHGLSPVLTAVPHWLRVLVLHFFARCLRLDVSLANETVISSSSTGLMNKRGSRRSKRSNSGKSINSQHKLPSVREQSTPISIRRPSSILSGLSSNYNKQGSVMQIETTIYAAAEQTSQNNNTFNSADDGEQINNISKSESSSSDSTSNLEEKLKEVQEKETIYVGIEELLDELQPRSLQRFLNRDNTTPYREMPLSPPRFNRDLMMTPPPPPGFRDDDGDAEEEEEEYFEDSIDEEQAAKASEAANINNNMVSFYVNAPPNTPLSLARKMAERQVRPPLAKQKRQMSSERSPFLNNNQRFDYRVSNSVITASPTPSTSTIGWKSSGRSRFEHELLSGLLRSVGFMVKREHSENTTELIVAEWRMIAFVLDRLAFWLFFAFTMAFIVTFLVIMPMREHAMHGHNMTQHMLMKGVKTRAQSTHDDH